MFDHRLGLALGKSIKEIRALTFEEWYSWWFYSEIEPFGWPDSEYRTAAILAQLHNVNQAKRGRAKKVIDFTRDIIKHILNYKEPKNFEDLSREEQLAIIRKDMGIRK